MSSGDRSCHLCGDMVPGDNLAHHSRRNHDGSDEGTAEDPVSRRSSSGSDQLSNTLVSGFPGVEAICFLDESILNAMVEL